MEIGTAAVNLQQFNGSFPRGRGYAGLANPGNLPG